jgi:hypothetical protein
LHDLRRAVGGAVVQHHHAVGLPRLPRDRCQRLREERFAIERAASLRRMGGRGQVRAFIGVKI